MQAYDSAALDAMKRGRPCSQMPQLRGHEKVPVCRCCFLLAGPQYSFEAEVRRADLPLGSIHMGSNGMA